MKKRRERRVEEVGWPVFAVLSVLAIVLFAGPALAAGPEEAAAGGNPAEPGNAEPAVDVAADDGGEHCVASNTVMCLQDGRYEVTVSVRVSAEAEPQPARVVKGGSRPIGTNESGLFYFFDPTNWEMLLKVLNGCGVNRHHWVFAAAATDVGYEIAVRDTTLPDDGSVVNRKVYSKAPGAPAPALTAVDAFPDACAA